MSLRLDSSTVPVPKKVETSGACRRCASPKISRAARIIRKQFRDANAIPGIRSPCVNALGAHVSAVCHRVAVTVRRWWAQDRSDHASINHPWEGTALTPLEAATP